MAKERKVKKNQEEHDQASFGKLVASLLDQEKEQDVKYQDGESDQASTV